MQADAGVIGIAISHDCQSNCFERRLKIVFDDADRDCVAPSVCPVAPRRRVLRSIQVWLSLQPRLGLTMFSNIFHPTLHCAPVTAQIDGTPLGVMVIVTFAIVASYWMLASSSGVLNSNWIASPSIFTSKGMFAARRRS